MNGYLGLLAARTLGQMPTLRPRPRSLFEPAPDPGVHLDGVGASVSAATWPSRAAPAVDSAPGGPDLPPPQDLYAPVSDGVAGLGGARSRWAGRDRTAALDELGRASAPPAAPTALAGDAPEVRPQPTTGGALLVGAPGRTDRLSTHLSPASVVGPAPTGMVHPPAGSVLGARSGRGLVGGPPIEVGHDPGPGPAGAPAELPGRPRAAPPPTASGVPEEVEPPRTEPSTGWSGRLAPPTTALRVSEEVELARTGQATGWSGRLAGTPAASRVSEELEPIRAGPATGWSDHLTVASASAAGQSAEPGRGRTDAPAGVAAPPTPATPRSGWTDEPGRGRAELGDGLIETGSGADRPVVDGSRTGNSPRLPAAAETERLAHRTLASRTAGAARGAGRVGPADVDRAADGGTPTVTVNIGRVEVRSLPPPPPPPAAPVPGPQPLSLEAYLERRNGGS